MAEWQLYSQFMFISIIFWYKCSLFKCRYKQVSSLHLEFPTFPTIGITVSSTNIVFFSVYNLFKCRLLQFFISHAPSLRTGVNKIVSVSVYLVSIFYKNVVFQICRLFHMSSFPYVVFSICRLFHMSSFTYVVFYICRVIPYQLNPFLANMEVNLFDFIKINCAYIKLHKHNAHGRCAHPFFSPLGLYG